MISADFVDAERFPEIRFVSTMVKRTSERTATMTGDLTLRGATKPMTLAVTIMNHGDHPIGAMIDTFKGRWLGAQAETVINRSEWGIDRFIPLASDAIRVVISTAMKAQWADYSADRRRTITRVSPCRRSSSTRQPDGAWAASSE